MLDLLAGWPDLPISSGEVADGLAEWVEGLRQVDPGFSEWRESGRTKAAALANPVLSGPDWARIVAEGDEGSFGSVSVWCPLREAKLGVSALWEPTPGARNHAYLMVSESVVSEWSEAQIRELVVKAAEVWNPRFVTLGPIGSGLPDRDGFVLSELNYVSDAKRNGMPELEDVTCEKVANGWLFRASDAAANDEPEAP